MTVRGEIWEIKHTQPVHLLPFQSLTRIHLVLGNKSIIQTGSPNYRQFRYERSIQALAEDLCVVLLPELFIAELKYGPEIASHWKPKLWGRNRGKWGKKHKTDEREKRCVAADRCKTESHLVRKDEVTQLQKDAIRRQFIRVCVSWWQQDREGMMMMMSWHTRRHTSWLGVYSRTPSCSQSKPSAAEHGDGVVAEMQLRPKCFHQDLSLFLFAFFHLLTVASSPSLLRYSSSRLLCLTAFSFTFTVFSCASVHLCF